MADAPIDAQHRAAERRQSTGPVAAARKRCSHAPDQFVQAFTQKLMMYALGRELEYHDMPQVRAIVRAAANDDYRLSAIVAGYRDERRVPPPSAGARQGAHERAGRRALRAVSAATATSR